MSSGPLKCRTILIEDSPELSDLLAPSGETGPHERVARSLAELILSGEAGGKIIGLEGNWGAGKTTVINLAENLLKGDPNITMFSFDAWAHEGDPLRRTYLESLIRHFKPPEKDWIDGERWTKTLDSLANRRRVERSRTIPDATKLGVAIAIAAFLVPIGAVLSDKLWKESMRLDPKLSINWWLVAGLLLTAAPVLVVAANTFRIVFKRIAAKHKGAEAPADPTDDWAFLKGSIEVKNTETTESPDPTSIEFEDHFRALMREALHSPKRRAVLVLDNLDRTSRQNALAIWSTLQTFLQVKSRIHEKWFDRLSILVPYDPVGLRKLWGKTDPNENREGVDEVWQSFIDKSFQVRFEVPPPVLSQWKDYLFALLARALPDHSPEDWRLIYRVFNLSGINRSENPTPRELKIYVNQIGAIHRQWQDDLAIGAVAYYVGLRRYLDQAALRESLVHGTLNNLNEVGSLIGESIDLRGTLAAVLFNVTPKLATQCLLGGPIYDSLVKQQPGEIRRLEQTHKDGFWAVMEEVAVNRIAETPSADLGKIALCLEESGILKEHSGNEVTATRNSIKKAVTLIPVWSDLNYEAVSAVAAICRVALDETTSERVLDAVRKQLAAQPTLPFEAITGLGLLFNEVEELGHRRALKRPFVIPGSGSAWIEISSTVMKLDQKWRSLIKVEGASFKEICDTLSGMVSAGDFAKVAFRKSVLPLAQEQFDKRDWNPFDLAIHDRLQVGQNVQPAEIVGLLSALWDIREDGCDASKGSFESLAETGTFLSWLGEYESDIPCTAWCFVSFLSQLPDAPMPTARSAKALDGYRTLIRILAQADTELAKEILTILRASNNTGFLLKVADARGSFDPLILECLRVAVVGSPIEFIPAVALFERWKSLRDDLGEGTFQQLVKHLVEDSRLEEVVRNQHSFKSEDADLYSSIISAPSSEAFISWIQSGLRSVEKNRWLAEMQEQGPLLNLALLVMPKQGGFLRSDFQDAVVQYAQEIANGSQSPNLEFRQNDVLALLDVPSRKLLPGRLLHEGIPQDGSCADAFFQLFGDLIGDIATLRGEPKIIVQLFSRLIEDRSLGGLHWLKETLTRNPSLLESGFESYSVDDFRGRIQDELSRPASNGAHELIEEIAAILHITPRSSDSEQDAQATTNSES